MMILPVASSRADQIPTLVLETPDQLSYLHLVSIDPAVAKYTGIRTTRVLTVDAATLAAFIGAGGLGEPIVTGLQLASSAMILSGAIPAAVLALVVDALLGWVERALRPRGVEARA